MAKIPEKILHKIKKISNISNAYSNKLRIIHIICMLCAMLFVTYNYLLKADAQTSNISKTVNKLKLDSEANPQARAMQEIIDQMPTREELLTAQPDDYTEGNKAAPNVIIEYSSVGCGHCAAYHFEVLPKIKANFIDKGKVFYIYRDFPINAQSFSASLLASCGSKLKNNYMVWANQLFQTQISWLIPSRDYLDKLLNIAKLNGLKREEFDQCMADKDTITQIGKRIFYAEKVLGVRYTPSIFVNGQYIEGHATYEHIVKALKP